MSIAGFLALWVAAGAPPALRQIAIVDAALLPILALAAWRHVSA